MKASYFVHPKGFLVTGALGLVILSLASAPLCWAQAPEPSDPGSPGQMGFFGHEYLTQGYKVLGPIDVSETFSGGFKLYGGKRNLDYTFEFARKRVQVFNDAGNALSPNAIQKGTRVRVFYKSDAIVVVVLTKKEDRNDV